MSGIIQKEFSRSRLRSLYSDFAHLKTHNAEGFDANMSEWKAILAGYFERNSSIICFHGKKLESDLEDPLFGRPKSLGLVLEQMVKEGTIQPREKFGKSESVMMDLLTRSFSMLGVFEFKATDKSGVKNVEFVVVQNVVKASQKLKNLDNIYTKEHLFHLLKEEPEFSKMENLEVCLANLGASVDNETVRLDGREITESDTAVAGLQYGIYRQDESSGNMGKEVILLREKAQQLLQEHNVSSARALLKKKKLLEKALSQQAGSTDKLTELYYRIQSAQANADVLSLLEANSMVLKKLNEEIGGADRVDEVLDKIREESAKVDEIGEVMGSGVDDDVEAELEEMEKMEESRSTQKHAAPKLGGNSTQELTPDQLPDVPPTAPDAESGHQILEKEKTQSAETS